jgi:hypothetical protein
VTGPAARHGLALDRQAAEQIKAAAKALREDPRPPEAEMLTRVARFMAYPGRTQSANCMPSGKPKLSFGTMVLPIATDMAVSGKLRMLW